VKLIIDFKRRLRGHNKALEDYGLQFHPGTKDVINLNTPTELEEKRTEINVPVALAKLHQLNQDYPNNDDQKAFLDHLNVSFLS
jgi:hypothetical protein